MVDGIKFPSKAEARRYGQLLLLWRSSYISDLELQPVYELHVGDIRVGKYIADFRYYAQDGELIVEDVKGMRTPVYRLKKRMVEAQYGIVIKEITC